jgi:hypothetical protein
MGNGRWNAFIQFARLNIKCNNLRPSRMSLIASARILKCSQGNQSRGAIFELRTAFGVGTQTFTSAAIHCSALFWCGDKTHHIGNPSRCVSDVLKQLPLVFIRKAFPQAVHQRFIDMSLTKVA